MQITNTLSGTKEQFTPQDPAKVTMYVCGITPYDYAHVGHGRCYVVFDIVYRLLTFLGHEVRYCRNFTDIDDKLLERAREKFGDKMRYTDLADQFIEAYQQNMQQLNCMQPTYQPRVTEHMPQIIAFVQKLIDKGHAYVANGSVYFSIKSYPAYGALSKHNVDDLRAGARVDVSTEKQDPLDFALWKAEAEGEFWHSPWGYGRPGWHIECSALALRYLGETLDVHAGGLDLVFPHHENELAQSQAALDVPFVRYWMHNGFVRINKEKMSKSLGNFFTLNDIFKKYDPMVIRYYFAQHHYRSPLDFAFDDIESAQKSYVRLVNLFAPSRDKQLQDDVVVSEFPLVKRMVEALQADMNVSALWAVVFESMAQLREDEPQRDAVYTMLREVMGLTFEPLHQEVVHTPEIERLIAEREQARADKHWQRADELREQLRELGIDVQDRKIKK